MPQQAAVSDCMLGAMNVCPHRCDLIMNVCPDNCDLILITVI